MKTLKQERGYGNNMKKLLLGIGVGIGVVTALALAPVGFNPVNNTEAASEVYPTSTSSVNGECPAGSYEIGRDAGKPICKLEPTGCPWGDSVPLDKCSPPPDVECNEDWTVCKPKTESEGNNVDNTSGVPSTGSTSSQEEHSTSYTCGK